ncbi:hypothetical protein [Sediminibacterium sp.]|uniref:hypothetical protein n=1 Tax=Sediminibacterium sp. TaxID=1917865 RepID=UPI003F6ED1FA
MRKTGTINDFFQKLNACFFVLALVWLTMSAPFVMANQFSQDHLTGIESPIDSGGEEDAAKPLNNTSEEKPHNCNGLVEEFIHHSVSTVAFHFSTLSHGMHLHQVSYQDYHGELLVPPPNKA